MLAYVLVIEAPIGFFCGLTLAACALSISAHCSKIRWI